MYRITILLLLGMLLCGSLPAQEDCDEPLCQSILQLKLKNEEQVQHIYKLSWQIQQITEQYEKLQKASVKDDKQIQLLETRINAYNEAKRKLEGENDELKKLLAAAYLELGTKTQLTLIQAKLLEQSKIETKDFKNKLDATNADNRLLNEELKDITFENSFFSNVDLGYSQHGGMQVVKTIYKDGEKIIDKRFLSNRLNQLQLSGRIYIPVSPYNKINQLPGRILIYANNKLQEVLEYVLVDKSTGRRFYHHFEIDKALFELQRKFPEGADLKIAFIDERTYSSTPQEILEQFWIAQNKGLFTITSLKPRSRIEALTLDKILESSKVVGTPIRTTKQNLTIKLFDNGTVDHDRADFYLNNTKILGNYELTSEVYKKDIYLQKGINKLSIIPLDIGTEPPCTVTVQIFDGEKFISELVLHGDIGYSESILIEVE